MGVNDTEWPTWKRWKDLKGHFWLLPHAHRVRTRRALPARCKCYRQGHLQKPAQCGTNVMPKYTKWPRSPTKQPHFSSSESCWVQSIHIPASICAAIQSARHGLPCLQRVKKTTELDTFIWSLKGFFRMPMGDPNVCYLRFCSKYLGQRIC